MDVSDAKNYPYQANREQEEEIADMLVQRNLTQSGLGWVRMYLMPLSFLVTFVHPSYLSCFAEKKSIFLQKPTLSAQGATALRRLVNNAQAFHSSNESSAFYKILFEVGLLNQPGHSCSFPFTLEL